MQLNIIFVILKIKVMNIHNIEAEYLSRISDPKEDKDALATEINLKLASAENDDLKTLYYKLYVNLLNERP